LVGQAATVFYFLFFIFLIPIIGTLEAMLVGSLPKHSLYLDKAITFYAIEY
jgi:hypothetical protein